MKNTRFLLGACGALLLTTTSGCVATGEVEYSYVLLDSTVTAFDCDDFGVVDVRMLVGDDLNGDGFLDNNEVQDTFTDSCNQFNNDNDPDFDADDIGFFSGVYFADSYELFAMEFLDAADNPIPWSPENDALTAAERITFFGVGVDVFAGVITTLDFGGALNGELTAFLFP